MLVQDSDERTLSPGRNEIGWTTVWTDARQAIEFEIDSDQRFAETSERNYHIPTWSDAIAIGFWVERKIAETFNHDALLRTIGATSVEDWLQLQVLRFNGMAALAIYPESPASVADRFRINHIVVVDGALPLSPPPPELQLDLDDPPSFAQLPELVVLRGEPGKPPKEVVNSAEGAGTRTQSSRCDGDRGHRSAASCIFRA